MKRIIFLIVIAFYFPIQAQPFSEIPISDGAGFCDTRGKFSVQTQASPDPENPLYYSKTRVTFYGDSRIDFANAVPLGYNPALYYAPLVQSADYPGRSFSMGLFYGMSSLDFYLGTDPSWNIQNFGHGGDSSLEMFNHLKQCLGRPNYFIAPNVAFEIGGNDYLQNMLMIMLLPWNAEAYINRALNHIERSITLLYQKRKNVLIVGNYPAVSWSALLGLPDEHKGFAFKTLNFKYQYNIQMHSITDPISFANKQSSIPEILNEVLREYNGFSMLELMSNATNGISFNVSSADTTCYGAHIPQNAFAPFFCWLAANLLAPGTLPSHLMLRQELKYPEIQARRQPYFQTQGLMLEYLRIWAAFINPVTYEPWVVNDVLMGDIVHPNAIGLSVWGNQVASKIKNMGWHLPGIAPVTPPPPPPTDSGGEIIDRPEPKPISDLELLILCFWFGFCHI
ncbi:LIC10707 family hydrolase [Leptospira levettii]|uniref:LIC10707 family hydrolase n=1 Tax=Leptospira levettii TaxID=2023178 RepID=UPI001AEF3732|nr:lipase [Leptospira levettii]